jgi:hypothetical protein
MAVLFLLLLIAFIAVVILVLTIFQAAVSHDSSDSRRASGFEVGQSASDTKFLQEIGIRSN